MSKFKVVIGATLAAAVLAAATPSFAAQCNHKGGFDAFLADYKKDAASQGISRRGLAALELNRQKVSSDPMVRTFLQGWRMVLAGNAEMDVFQDVTG